ncbi:MAG: choice-of-anchor Q domain-containing protein [Chloroflexota bacterium]
MFIVPAAPTRAALAPCGTITVTNTLDTGPGSLRDAIAAACPGDTITFNLPAASGIVLLSTIQISSNLTIDASAVGGVTLYGGLTPLSAANIAPLNITGGSVQLIDISVLNGYGPVMAGGIFNAGVLQITGGTLSGNRAGFHGGSISNFGSLTLDGVTFTGNQATYQGGAISNMGYLEMHHTSLSSNRVTQGNGGAIFHGIPAPVRPQALTAVAWLDNITMTENTASENGGAIYAMVPLHISGGTFTGNESATGGYSGGAIAYHGSATPILGQEDLSLEDITFQENISGMGGALYVVDASVGITHTDFLTNTAGQGGGLDFSTVSSAVLDGVTFQGNQADLAGAMFVTNSTLPIEAPAQVSGETATVIVRNSLLVGNNGSTGAGAVGSIGSSLLITNCLLMSNTTLGGSGAILNMLSASMSVYNSAIVSNHADGIGAVSNMLDSSLVIVRSAILSNTIGSGYGAGIFNGSQLTLANVTLAGNAIRNTAVAPADSQGGAAIYSGGTLPSAPQRALAASGAGLTAPTPPQPGAAVADIYNTTIANNIDNSGAGNGVVWIEGGQLTIGNSLAANNQTNRFETRPSQVQESNALQAANFTLGTTASLTSLGGNLSDTTDGLLLQPSDLEGVDPGVAGLLEYAPQRWTLALDAGAVAVDAGLDTICANEPVGGQDQRGALRPAGAACDSGAYEAAATTNLSAGVSRLWEWVLIGAHQYVTATVANLGPVVASNAVLTVTLPSDVLVDNTLDPHCTFSAPQVVCALGALEVDQSFTQTLYLLLTPAVPDASTLTVTAAAADLPGSSSREGHAASRQPALDEHQVDFEALIEKEVLVADAATNPELATQAPNGQRFLGEFNQEYLLATWVGSQEYRYVRASWDLYILRSWDGNQVDDLLPPALRSPGSIVGPDHWQMILNGSPTIDTTFTNWSLINYRQSFPLWQPGGSFPAQTEAKEVNTLGYTFGPYIMDSIYHFSIYKASSSPEGLTMGFGATGLQPIEDESWGINNLYMYVRALPLPSVYLPLINR